MLNIFAFGHFFGFSSVANYAATIYPRGLELSQTVIKRFKFSDLIDKKNRLEETYEFNKLLIEQAKAAETSQDPKNILKLEKRSNSVVSWLRRVNKIQSKMEDRLTGGKLSDSYIDVYSKAVMPMFPFAGTYSIIMLLLFGFAESYKEDEIIFINIILILNFFMFSLIIFNIKFCKRHFSIWKRTLLLCGLISIFTFISGCLACFFFHYPEYTISNISNLKLLLIILTSLFLSGVPLFLIIFKSARLWWALHYYEKIFKIAFWNINRHFRKMQLSD